MLKMIWSNPLCGRASSVKIKRKQVTKLKKELRQKCLKLEDQLVIQTFQTLLKLVLIEND